MSGGYRFLLSPRWLGYYALMLVGVVVCVSLSIWQGERREQRLEEIRHVTENYDGPLHSLGSLLPARDTRLPESEEWSRVELHGRYEERTLLARNRPLNQQSGFEAVVPFVLDDGSTLLISRGWIATDARGGAPESVPAPPPGEVTVTVRLRPAQDGSGDSNPAGILLAIDPAVVPGLEDPYLGAYGVLENEQPAATEALQAMPRPDVSEGSHLSYQMQWLAFGAMVVIGGVYAARREARSRTETAGSEPTEYVVVDKAELARRDRPKPPPPQTRRRRTRRDDAEEDALIDQLRRN